METWLLLTLLTACRKSPATKHLWQTVRQTDRRRQPYQ